MRCFRVTMMFQKLCSGAGWAIFVGALLRDSWPLQAWEGYRSEQIIFAHAFLAGERSRIIECPILIVSLKLKLS